MNLSAAFQASSWQAVAQDCRSRGDLDGEEAALNAQLEADPRDLWALLQMGDLLVRLGDQRGAFGFYRKALRCASALANVPAALHPHLLRVQGFVQHKQAHFAGELRDRMRNFGLGRGSLSPRVSHAMRLLMGEERLYLQQPSKFYFPGLAQRPFFERSEFSWLPEFEACTPAIKQDVEAIIAAGDAGFSPHTVASPRVPPPSSNLLNDPKWSAYHLWQRGKELVDHTRRAPATVAALGLAPIPRINRWAPMIMFSLLKPGTHIEPHYGLTNTRLICHLPIFAPRGCALRVGGSTRPWEEGKTLIFDDSFEHEAWNRGTETRVVLLFEVWRPDLALAERDELTALYEAVELSDSDDG